MLRTALLCIYYKVYDRYNLTQVATLTFFLCVAPLFDVLVQFLACIDIIVDESGLHDRRAFYFAEVSCYTWYQNFMMALFVSIVVMLLVIMFLHHMKNVHEDELALDDLNISIDKLEEESSEGVFGIDAIDDLAEKVSQEIQEEVRTNVTLAVSSSL